MTITSMRPSLENERERRAESYQYGYMPGEELIIDPSLQLHSEYDTDIDPVGYEVLRSKLWNINVDHQETIRRVSGSSVVAFGYDFNTSIQTEDGAGVCFGPGNLFFGGCADLVVRWTLEHRSMNVGIEPGDIFVQSDPWVGTNHAMDAAVYAPVFWEGKLFAWVYNVVHQRELGGIEPGGFVQQAHDVYAESTFFPPTKLVEGGVFREDIADAWVRRSRLPGLMTLELRSQVSGVEFAHAGLMSLIRRYGVGQVKGVMRKMISTTASVVGERIAELPDGEWSDSRYAAGAVVGDLSPYKFRLSVRKEGDRLRYSNAGTDPSVGSFNITSGVLRSAIVNSLLTFLCYDQYLCAAGLLEQVDFDFERGTITAASHPAAISTSLGLTTSLVQGQYLNAKVFSGREELAHHTFGPSGTATLIVTPTFGTDQYGSPASNLPLDCIVGGIGAFPWRDGLDHGGTFNSPMSPVGSVEEMERETPILYLYRREASRSGGHGRWRGGACITAAYVGHRTPEHYISSGGLVQSVTQGTGLFGGLPASGGTLWRAEDTAVREWLSDGRVPGTPAELREMAPDLALAPPKVYNNRLLERDVFEVLPCAGAGYGDPILREPERVADDIVEKKLTAEDALSIYGVVLEGGEVDAAATARRREQLLGERLEAARPPREPHGGRLGKHDCLATATVAIGSGGEGRILGCARCGQELSTEEGNYRLGAAELEREVEELGPHFVDPEPQVGVKMIWRTYLCPDCGTSLDGELCRPEDEPYWDVRMGPPRDDEGGGAS
jgi:N-methylhydantoinase B